MPPRPQIDAAIITVIGVELQAVIAALRIDQKKRLHNDGAIYYEAKIYSRLLNRELALIVTCIGEPSQATAGLRADRVIAEFDPALLILVGIAAGIRNKLRIGDVIVPKAVADFSVNVLREEGAGTRPVITEWSFPIKQMMPGFSLNVKKFHERCRTLFGPPIEPPAGKEVDFQDHVTFTPRVLDNAIGTADNLLKVGSAFERMVNVHENIRAAEMEAGGLIKACGNHSPPRAWLVARGISDFGDEFKNDEFHRLASCAAAAWVTIFLEDGLDVENLRPSSGQLEENISTVESVLAPELGMVRPAAHLNPIITDLVNTQIERLATASSSDRQRDFEEIREEWRINPGRPVIERLRALKSREDWLLIAKEIRAKILRYEASLTLSLDRDVTGAQLLLAEALKLDPDLDTEVLNALIAFHRDRRSALAQLVAPTTQEGWNLRLGLLAEKGEWKLLFDESEKPPVMTALDAETRRLRALALLHNNDRKNARAELTVALGERPKWFNLRLLDAVVAYFESLSEPLFFNADKNWPEPADPTLVNRDRVTLDNLSRAERILNDLVAIPGLDPQIRAEIEGWRLGCLGNDPERQNEARGYCATLLEQNPTHHVALAWAMARGYTTDLTSSIDALFKEFIQG